MDTKIDNKDLSKAILEVRTRQVEASQALKRVKEAHQALEDHVRVHGGQVLGNPESPLIVSDGPKVEPPVTPLSIYKGLVQHAEQANSEGDRVMLLQEARSWYLLAQGER